LVTTDQSALVQSIQDYLSKKDGDGSNRCMPQLSETGAFIGCGAGGNIGDISQKLKSLPYNQQFSYFAFPNAKG